MNCNFRKLQVAIALNAMVPALIRIDELAGDLPPEVIIAVKNLQAAYDLLNNQLLPGMDSTGNSAA